MTETVPPAAKNIPITQLGTTMGRARCPQATQLLRMRHSLSKHGQMTPVIAVERQGKLEMVDGFKRRAAAVQMGWTSLLTSVRPLDERAQWVAMLTLNRTPGSLSVMEEALILRELIHAGMTQMEVAELVGRHKSWVSRRMGLVEKLHPDLVEWVRTGLLSPGTARRLFVLPAGNQLEMAAVVTQQELSTQETELLVSLWHKTSEPEVRSFLLKEPRKALAHAKPEDPRTPTDPRLTPRGQTLQRSLRIMQGVGTRVVQMLRPPPVTQDLEILKPELKHLTRLLPALTEVVGTVRKSNSSDDRSATNATPKSDSCSSMDTASRPPPAKPMST
jgi:ParB/RepB/Spo0J family partition protein